MLTILHSTMLALCTFGNARVASSPRRPKDDLFGVQGVTFVKRAKHRCVVVYAFSKSRISKNTSAPAIRLSPAEFVRFEDARCGT
jgi:hypothetical protein